MIQCAKWAPEVHTFWPLTTKWSPWSTARVQLPLPDATALEGFAIGRDAIVGRIVEAQLGREIRGEPIAEFFPEAFVLGSEFEIHDGRQSRLVGGAGRCQADGRSDPEYDPGPWRTITIATDVTEIPPISPSRASPSSVRRR